MRHTAINNDGVKAKRVRLLAESDWTQGSDAPLSIGMKKAWADYRQAIRDMPRSPPWVWPAKPTTAAVGETIVVETEAGPVEVSVEFHAVKLETETVKEAAIRQIRRYEELMNMRVQGKADTNEEAEYQGLHSRLFELRKLRA
jgi:hypothetical protein